MLCSMKKKISKDMLISEVIEKFPFLEEIFWAYGLHCTGCSAAEFDTIESGWMAHDFPREELEEMLEVMNEMVEKKLSNKEKI